MAKYKVLADSHDAKAGEIVYDFSGCTYGCVSDDTRGTGIEHVGLTRNSDGSGPFLTAPKRDLQVTT